jgi:hypothetical protein
VVYSASPETREKGRYYMMRLLELVPTAKLIDMFVSDEIDRIFEKVREEFYAKQHGFGLDTLTLSLPARPGNTTGKPSPHAPEEVASDHAKYWIAGSAAILTLGGAAVALWVLDTPKPKPREIIVPKENP